MRRAASAILILTTALVLGGLGVEHYWLRSVKFDDAWRHFRYAEHLSRGDGFVYNVGHRVLGSGGVLWEFVLWALATATRPVAEIGDWLNARSSREDWVCVSEIGAFGFHYHGNVLDAVGLVSPEAAPYQPVPPTVGGGFAGVIPPQLVKDHKPVRRFPQHFVQGAHA